MPAQFSLQPLTYHCLFGLLAVTGLRISEALNLESRDVNWAEGVLTIRTSKFGKSRLVPLHPTTKDVLSDYALQRIQRFPDRPTSAFFPSRTGAHLDPGQVRRIFYRISRQIGIRGASASHGPRLHDFRHRFAVETLLRWYRSGEDVRRRLPILSTYLGHSSRHRYVLVPEQHPRADGFRRRLPRETVGRSTMNQPADFPAYWSRSLRSD